MTRNDDDLLRLNILHHLWHHCERVIVVDNASTTSSRRILKRLARRHAVDWTHDRGELRQPEIVTEMAHDARAKGADWVIPLDTDEFWHAGRLIPDVLADAGDAGALIVERIEFIQTRARRRPSPRGVLEATMRVDKPLLGDAVVHEFIARERSLFEIAPTPKLILRTSEDLEIDFGGHVARGVAGPRRHTDEMAIFHLPLRSRKGLQHRAEQGRRLARVTDDPMVSYQNRYWTAMEQEGLLDEGWAAHSWADGGLDVFGRHVELVEDRRLTEILWPLVLSPRRELRARLTGRPW